jgi:hypothetical protein
MCHCDLGDVLDPSFGFGSFCSIMWEFPSSDLPIALLDEAGELCPLNALVTAFTGAFAGARSCVSRPLHVNISQRLLRGFESIRKIHPMGEGIGFIGCLFRKPSLVFLSFLFFSHWSICLQYSSRLRSRTTIPFFTR